MASSTWLTEPTGLIAELGGRKGAWFKDPEGNILSVVQLPAT